MESIFLRISGSEIKLMVYGVVAVIALLTFLIKSIINKTKK